MERGTIRHFDRERGYGSIQDSEGREIQFYANSVVSKDKSLSQGDGVWFERENIRSHVNAINIRKS